MKHVLVLVLLSVPAVWGFNQNPAIANLSDNSFYLMTSTWCSAPWNTTAYSGSVYDHHRHKILLFGGGHSTDGSNAVCEFDIDSAKWTALYDPTPCERYVPEFCVYDSSGTPCGGIYGLDGRPMASTRHSYDGLIMLPDTCLMAATTGPFGGSGGSYCPLDNDHNDWCGTAFWFFDPYTLNWSHTKAGLSVGTGAPTAINPYTKKVYQLRAGASLFTMSDYKAQTQVTLCTWDAPNWEGYRSMCYYGPNNSLVFFGETNVWEWKIDYPESSWTLKNPAGSHADSYNREVRYDSVNNVFVLFKGGVNYYSPSANQWYNLPYSNGSVSDPQYFHAVYDPVNNVHIFLDNSRRTWAYKLSDTPGTFPGTSGGTAVKRTAGVLPGVTLTVEPNPFNSGTSISIMGKFQVTSCKLSIFNINGKQLETFNLKLETSNTVSWNPSGLSAGIYLIRARVGGKVLQKKVVLQK